MREIKFRAWNGKEMYYNPILWDGLVFRNIKDFMNGIDITNPIMQYTGFKDIKGNEVYEKDYLYLEDGTRDYGGIVEFDKDTGQYVVNIFLEQGGYESEKLSEWVDCAEVIGNEYEPMK